MAGRKATNETGNRHGCLTVLCRYVPEKPTRSAQWLCQCDCGAKFPVFGHHLRAREPRKCQGADHRPDRSTLLEGAPAATRSERLERAWAAVVAHAARNEACAQAVALNLLTGAPREDLLFELAEVLARENERLALEVTRAFIEASPTLPRATGE